MAQKNYCDKTIRKWDKKGYPQKGWELKDVTDLESSRQNCFFCGISIRYVHHIYHDEKSLEADVGSDCSEQLTENYYTGGEFIRQLKANERKINNWLKETWEVTNFNGHEIHELNLHGIILNITSDIKGIYSAKITVSDNRITRLEQSSSDLDFMKKEVFKKHSEKF